MRFKIVLLIITLFQVKSVYSQTRWTPIYSDKAGNKFSADSFPVSNHEGIIQMWIKEKIKSKRIDGLTYTDIACESLMSFDCNLRKTAIVSESYVTKHMTRITLKLSKDETDWKDVKPKTTSDNLLLWICKKYNK